MSAVVAAEKAWRVAGVVRDREYTGAANARLARVRVLWNVPCAVVTGNEDESAGNQRF